MNLPSAEATRALGEIEGLLAKRPGPEALTEVCAYLRRAFPRYRWVGVYALHGEMLELAGWNGPAATEHTRIPIGRGVCGRAARENRTVIVDDVRAAPEYLACFLETRAEIVVPIRAGSVVVGEIDIDGNEVGAFDGSDQLFLERVAATISPRLAGASVRASPRD
jgi:L-methionine (R)-S-oxide reductase